MILNASDLWLSITHKMKQNKEISPFDSQIYRAPNHFKIVGVLQEYLMNMSRKDVSKITLTSDNLF